MLILFLLSIFKIDFISLIILLLASWLSSLLLKNICLYSLFFALSCVEVIILWFIIKLLIFIFKLFIILLFWFEFSFNFLFLFILYWPKLVFFFSSYFLLKYIILSVFLNVGIFFVIFNSIIFCISGKLLGPAFLYIFSLLLSFSFISLIKESIESSLAFNIFLESLLEFIGYLLFSLEKFRKFEDCWLFFSNNEKVIVDNLFSNKFSLLFLSILFSIILISLLEFSLFTTVNLSPFSISSIILLLNICILYSSFSFFDFFEFS